MDIVLAAMSLSNIDWGIIFTVFLVILLIGLYSSKEAGKSQEEYFLGGRSMPWWLLGASMVATTFSADTPNFVTDLVRKDGVSSNWIWWSFLLTGMLTTFIYAKLWRRTGINTDIEFYELRYSGKSAAFLRGFRALYLGLFFNILIMAGVSLAAIKIGGVLLGFTPLESLLYASVITGVFCTLGGFKGVLLTDFILFILALSGAVAAAYYSLGHPAVGGISGLLDKFNSDPNLAGKLNIFPDPNYSDLFIGGLVIPLAIQWWSVWYPGAEPGGGGYLAQRMLAAKNEKDAVSASLFFNITHYAIRPWPWIIVALCSMVVYPELNDLGKAFPHIPEDKVAGDLAYSAMLTALPSGWAGIVLVSLIAAYISTISTHLNWGSSYIVNDWYKRFIEPGASNRKLVWLGRLSTLVLLFFSCLIALFLESAIDSFYLLLQIGAGTGLIYIIRWFWWRVNAISEIAAMVSSFLIAVFLHYLDNIAGISISNNMKLLISVSSTTIIWVMVTLLTKPTEIKTLINFVQKVKPSGPGWEEVRKHTPLTDNFENGDSLTRGVSCMFIGSIAIYCFLFSIGLFLFSRIMPSLMCALVSISLFITLYKIRK